MTAASEAASPAISFGKVASAAVEAAASSAAVDPSQQSAPEKNSAIEQLDEGGNEKYDRMVGQPETVFAAGQAENMVGDREQQAEVPGDNSAVAATSAAAFPVATAAGATGLPSQKEVVEETGYACEGGDGDQVAPPKLDERVQASSSTSAVEDAQRHREEEECASPKQSGGADDIGSTNDPLGGMNRPRSLGDGHEQGPSTSADGPDSDEVGLKTMVQFTKGGDGGEIQEGFDDGQGLKAQQGAANNGGDGSVPAEGSAEIERSNDETRREGASESEYEDDDEDENKEGEEGRGQDEEEPAKTDEENRCDLEAAVDSLQLLLVRHCFSDRH